MSLKSTSESEVKTSFQSAQLKKKNQMVTGFWRRRRKDGDAAVMTFQ